MTNRNAIVTLRKDLNHLNECCKNVHSQLRAAMIEELLSTNTKVLTEVFSSIPQSTLEKVYETFIYLTSVD